MRTLVLILMFLGLYGNVYADEVMLGQISYTRTDILTKKESRGAWIFTVQSDTGEVKILKYVLGSPFEKEGVTPWTRVTTFTAKGRLVYLQESFVFSSADMATKKNMRTNLGHVKTVDAETKEVIESWPIFCTVSGSTNFYETSCRTFQSDGGIYEVTRDFYRRDLGFTPIVERRKITDATGKVISHVVDSQN